MVYSRSYGVPVLLVGARRAAPPGDTLGHGELTVLLLEAAEAAAAAAAAGDQRDHGGGGDGESGGGGGGGGAGGGGGIGSGGVSGEGSELEGVSARVRRLTVSGLGDWGDEGGGGGSLSVFAPWEHPHLGFGCCLGVHPCQTAAVMRLLLVTTEPMNADSPSDPGLYMLAWIRLMAAAVADLPIPPDLGRTS